MAEITAQLVKQLRDRTSAGMMECKKALEEAKGDLADAEVVLRGVLGTQLRLQFAEKNDGAEACPINVVSGFGRDDPIEGVGGDGAILPDKRSVEQASGN